MSRSKAPTIRRAKPFLGTIVEIGLYCDEGVEGLAPELLERCFASIKDVHAAMSYFDPESDIGRLNRTQPGEFIEVAKDTAEVLRFSMTLFRESEGAFDTMYQGRDEFPTAHITFRGGRTIARSAPVSVDLGGVAKGYAVDRAARCVQSYPGVSAVINAGGDIRFVGELAFPLTLRSPNGPGGYCHVGDFAETSVATSVFWDGGEPVSISVVADSCMVADSLTKCAFRMGVDDRDALLDRYGARVIEVRAVPNPSQEASAL
jgi:FAD:protein FMN transferase